MRVWELEVLGVLRRNSDLTLESNALSIVYGNRSRYWGNHINHKIISIGLSSIPLFFVGKYGNLVPYLDNSKINKPVSYARNSLALSSLAMIGGGGLKLMRHALTHARMGGSTQDQLKYLASYDNNISSNWKMPGNVLNRVQDIMVGSNVGNLVIRSRSAVLSAYNANRNASSGFYGKKVNLGKKNYTVHADILFFSCIYGTWVQGHDMSIPYEMWNSAARPKLVHLTKDVHKIDKGESVARLISIPSTIENLVSMPISNAIKEAMFLNFRKNWHGIAIGCNRLGDDWRKMGSTISKYQWVICCDYSKFDRSVPRVLLEAAFEAIFSTFDYSDDVTRNYIDKFKKNLEFNFMNRLQIVNDDTLGIVRSGVPSGSAWTSIIDSVISLIIVVSFFSQKKELEVDTMIYGDDTLVMGNGPVDSDTIIEEFSNYVMNTFGMKVSKEDTTLTFRKDFFVTYIRSVYEPGEYLKYGTGNLKPIGYEYSDKEFTDFDHSKGTSHRWSYVFDGRIKFLQYYWLVDYAPIRPLRETITRIVNTETKVKTVLECFLLYLSHLTDNYHNKHVINWIYQMMYDLDHLDNIIRHEKCGVANKARRFALYLNPAFSRNAKLLRDKEARSFKSDLASGAFGDVKIADKLPPERAVRCWYRLTPEFPDFFTHPVMSNFNLKWDKICRLIEDTILTTRWMEVRRKKNMLNIFSDDLLYDRNRHSSFHSNVLTKFKTTPCCDWHFMNRCTVMYLDYILKLSRLRPPDLTYHVSTNNYDKDVIEINRYLLEVNTITDFILEKYLPVLRIGDITSTCIV